MIKKSLAIVAFLLLTIAQLVAQHSGSSDSLVNNPERVRVFTDRYNKKVVHHLKQYEHSRIVLEQNRRLNALKHFDERLDYFLKYGLDTVELYKNILLAEYGKQRALEGLQTPSNNFLSSGELASSQNTLQEILQSLTEIRAKLNYRIRSIEKYQEGFDSLVYDSNLFLIQDANGAFTNVLTDHLFTNERMMRNFAKLIQVNDQLHRMLARVNMLSGRLNYRITEINQKRFNLFDNILEQEQPYIWQHMEFDRTRGEVLHRSYVKERDLLGYSLINNRVSLAFIFLLSLIVAYIIKRVSRAIVTDGKSEVFESNLVFKNPILSTFFFSLIICQFVYFNAPVVMQGIIWSCSWVLALWFIYRGTVPFSNSKRSLYFLLLYPVIFIEQLLLDPFPYESWLILFASVVIVWILLYDWYLRKTEVPDLLMFRIVITFFTLVELTAAIAIILGRYNAGKGLMIAGYFGILTSLMLYWTKEIWLSALQIPITGLENRVQKRLYSNLKFLNSQSDYFINIIMYVTIAVSFCRNFFLYNEMIEYLRAQVTMVRHIGKYEFSWMVIFTFVSVLVVTVLITRIIALFFDDKLTDVKGSRDRKGIRNLGIVFKLVILSIGFIIAFAAAGVPMDKLTIILGSLGLGIGFGLQNIVSHMLSGIIIAFEQPFVVNDQVEWNGVLGRIKEVGLRSSKIAYMDGSEEVVPNTNLLNQRLVNWTHNHNMRRLEIVVGLAYGSDLVATKKIIEETLDMVKLVYKYPERQVYFDVFGDNAIQCRILIWVDVMELLKARSDVIVAIHQAFAEKGISIPFPQVDVHTDPVK